MPTYAHIPKLDGVPPDAAAFHCFESLAPVLLHFASRHSLLVRKYYQNQPMWSFHFLHPKGGFGTVQVHAAPVDAASLKAAVASHWWIDDEQTCQRALLSTRSVSLAVRQPEELTPALEEALKHLLALKPMDLTRNAPTSPRRRDGADNYVFNEFEQAQRLPT